MGHCCNRERAEYSCAFILASVQHHLCVNCNIADRGKQTRVPRDSAKLECSWIMNFSLHPMSFSFLGGRGPDTKALGRQVTGFRHSKRAEEILLRKFMNTLASHTSHDLAKQDVIHI